MLITKTFRYRLEPNAGQRELFLRYAGCCRFVFNHALEERVAAYEAGAVSLSYKEQCKRLPELKVAEDTSWLAEVQSQVLQQALKDLDAAYRHFFRRVKAGETPGFPKFRKKGRKDAFRFPQGVKVNDSRVYLPKIGWVRYRESRALEGRICQTTIKREGERWFVHLACEVNLPAPPPVAVTEEGSVGIDVGIKRFAVLSDGTEIENPRFLAKALAKLKRGQRALSRKEKRSKNWEKQRAKVAKLYLHVKNARKDFAHKVSTAIVKKHDVIAVEDLNIMGMLHNRSLSFAISDVGWGMFLRMLQYKAEWAGKHFVRIGRFVATTKACAACGQKQPMPLSVRTFACGVCGTVIDRDWNASLNIRSAGLAVLNACGGA